MTLDDLTDKQLTRLFLRILGRIREWSSGGPFGWDLPTLWICEPGLARAYKEVKAEGVRRKLR